MRHWAPQSFDLQAANKVAEPDPSVEQTSLREEAFLRGYKDGLDEGRRQGIDLGKQEGFEVGRAEGVRSGYQSGYDEGLKRIEPIGMQLRDLLEVLNGLPTELQASLTDWVYETALRLAGRESMERAWFESAVKEALGGLPRPGEELLVRVAQQDLAVWQQIFSPASDSTSSRLVVVDPALQSGQAYVEVRKLRIDVGAEARRALVRNALGLSVQPAPEGR
jgi:flagellar assembly protein FliH